MACECEKKDSRIKRLFLLLLLALLALGITTVLLLLHREKHSVPMEAVHDGVGLVIDPDTKSSQLSEIDNVEEQDVAISGRGSITIPANKSEVTVDFYNPKENEGLYYLTFELRLCDDSEQGYETLYTSGLVEPGKYVNQITLLHELEKGVYEAVVHVQPYRMNEKKTLTNNADIKTKLIVK